MSEGDKAGDTDEMPADEGSAEESAEEIAAREHLRRSGEAAKETAKSGWAALRGGGKAVGDRSKDVVDSGRETIDRSYRTVTLKAYRDEVDEAISEIVDVLAAQDAELRHLRARVETLESEQSTGDGQ